jgi:hypothetical protein
MYIDRTTEENLMSNDEIKKQGQDAQPIDGLSFTELNRHEQALVLTLNGEGTGVREYKTIVELMYANNWHVLGKAKGNSRVRNSLRRLVRGTWVEHAEKIGDGRYRITEAGRKRLRRFEAKSAEESAAKPVSEVAVAEESAA